MSFLQTILKNRWYLFLTVFVSNLCLHFIYIDNHSIWFDECLWVDVAEWDTEKIIELCRSNDPNPPLYPLILHYWIHLFGDSEIAIRSITAISSSLAGAFLFLLAYRFFNWQTSIFVSMMFFTSNEMFYYAQEARPYAIIILFAVMSYYVYLSLIASPNLWKAFILGAFNCILFYLHLLSAFCFVGQAVLFPFLIKQSLSFKTEGGLFSFSYSANVKVVLYYFLSWGAFYLLFLPWQTRFIELIKEGSKNYWLSKPTSADFKQTIYDFFNSKELYQVHVFSALAIVLLLILFKRFREENVSLKNIFFAFIIGPGLIYLNYKMASISPIFLKRYVLFTILGFMLLYSYIFSLLKFPFRYKFAAFLALSVFSFLKLTIPRETVFDYKHSVAFLKKKQTANTLIINDIPDLFSYYYDKEGAWKIKEFEERTKYLYEKKNVLVPLDIVWQKTFDFKKYKDVYYTMSFEGYKDPGLEVENYLRSVLIFKENISDYKGIKIVHFENPNFQQ